MTFQPFGIDVAGLVGEAFNGNTQDVILRKFVPGARVTGDASAGFVKTPVDYGAQGFITKRKAKGNEQNAGAQGSSQAKTAETQILLFGTLIEGDQVPAEEDQIIIDGVIYTVQTIESDDTKATYLCNCRG